MSLAGLWDPALYSHLSPSECSVTSQRKVPLSLVRQRESIGLTNLHSVRFTWIFPEHTTCQILSWAYGNAAVSTVQGCSDIDARKELRGSGGRDKFLKVGILKIPQTS